MAESLNSSQRDPQRQISSGRKTLYYVGGALALLGMLSFLSTFVSAALDFGDFTDFEARTRSMALRAVVGMFMMIAGGIIAGIGRAGAAGSGIVLDPERARKDVEPWSRMSGGVLGDVLDEAGIKLGGDRDSDREELPFDEKLRRLHQLYSDGIIDEAEYRREKQELLDSN